MRIVLTALVIFFRTFAMSALKTALLLGGTGATGKHVFEELKASEKIGKVIFLSRRDIQADVDNSKVRGAVRGCPEMTSSGSLNKPNTPPPPDHQPS